MFKKNTKMTHNLNSNSNNNEGFIISNATNSDSKSLEIHHEKLDKESNPNEYLNRNSLSENNSSVEEKCDTTINNEEKKMSKKRKHRRGKQFNNLIQIKLNP